MDTLDDFIDCKCPHCGAEGSFRREVAGLIEECPECTATLIVPRDGAHVARMIPLPIIMPRVALRRPQPADWKDLLEFLGEPEVYKYVDENPRDEEGIVKWLEEDQWLKLTTPEAVFSLVMENQPGSVDKKVIGIIYFNFVRGDRRLGSFRIYVSPKFQRQGFGTEALEGLLDFWFNGISLHRVTTACDSQNSPAIGLVSKVGMRREAEFLQDHMHDGVWANTLYYAMLADEYAKSRNAREL